MAKTYYLYGKRFTLAKLCRIYNQPRSTVESRLRKWQPIEKALQRNGRYNTIERVRFECLRKYGRI